MSPSLPSPPAFSFAFSSSVSAFNVPASEFLAIQEGLDGIGAGALIFDSQDRLLILQRAAHDSMPNLWEVPGGACDGDNETILDGIAREVWEESGLKVSRFGDLVAPLNGLLFTSSRGMKICKYTFQAEVESTDVVKLDPNEHQDYLWVTEEECRSHNLRRENNVVEFRFTTPPQEATILEGFRLRMAAKSSGQ